MVTITASDLARGLGLDGRDRVAGELLISAALTLLEVGGRGGERDLGVLRRVLVELARAGELVAGRLGEVGDEEWSLRAMAGKNAQA